MSRKRPKIISEMRRLREEMGMTLEDLSQASGLPVTTIRYLEAGLGKNFSLEIKKAVADALCVSGLIDFYNLFIEETARIQHARKED